jgi:hypothetical protein
MIQPVANQHPINDIKARTPNFAQRCAVARRPQEYPPPGAPPRAHPPGLRPLEVHSDGPGFSQILAGKPTQGAACASVHASRVHRQFGLTINFECSSKVRSGEHLQEKSFELSAPALLERRLTTAISPNSNV